VGPERFEPTIPTNRGIYIRLSSSSFVRTARSRLVRLEPVWVGTEIVIEALETYYFNY